MTKHYNIKIYGRVRGVFFRAGAKHEADKLGIVGFAKNESDGTVYIEAEGEEINLDKFVNWCREGPDLAKVEKAEVTEEPLKNFKEFEMY
jgi:acylphosphatase